MKGTLIKSCVAIALVATQIGTPLTAAAQTDNDRKYGPAAAGSPNSNGLGGPIASGLPPELAILGLLAIGGGAAAIGLAGGGGSSGSTTATTGTTPAD